MTITRDPISSATENEYSIAHVDDTYAGIYSVQVNDTYMGQVTSNTASLTVGSTGVPVLGVVGLALLAGAFAAGGVVVVRRRK